MIGGSRFDVANRGLAGIDPRRLPCRRTDTLVIGAGVAGLRAALAAAEHGSVLLLAGRGLTHANTRLSQGGIAIPLNPEDSADQHLEDTLYAGGGLCDPHAARCVIERGRARLAELIRWGLDIDRHRCGTPMLGLEGGHRRRRIVHTHGDATGRALSRVLLARVRRTGAITIAHRYTALDFLVAEDIQLHAPRVLGAIVHHPATGVESIFADATILATGGAAGIYESTTNIPSATGDGIAMAWRAGADLRGMEFVQFHPTALDTNCAPMPLISEAVRGEGALLVDHEGKRLMAGVHPMQELAPRDVVSATIARLQRSRGPRCAWLDARPVSNFAARFPTIAAQLHEDGFDPTHRPLPVTPAAHYLVGGVVTDTAGRTSIPGLYAAGEVASTGLHGANRLASNSLLEGLVMGEAAGCEAAQQSRRTPWHENTTRAFQSESPRVIARQETSQQHPPRGRRENVGTTMDAIRSLMWSHVGILRCERQLRHAVSKLEEWREDMPQQVDANDPMTWKMNNALTVALLIARAALSRQASAGCHIRTDAPYHSHQSIPPAAGSTPPRRVAQA